MRREVELRRRMQGLSVLGEAVSAMKSLSAHHFRQARQAVAPARAYREGVERMLAAASASVVPGDGAAGLLIIGGELGLCGSYNAKLVQLGMGRRVQLGLGPTFCVGRRAEVLLTRRKVSVERSYGAPTSVDGIAGLLIQLAEDLLATYASEGLSSFHIVSSPFQGVGQFSPASIQLLPFASDAAARPPAPRYISAEHFASAAIREYLYIVLYDILLDALASEHGARLVATQGAERWLDERIDRLRRRLASAHREASTQEMIEIAAGAAARRRRA